MFLIPETPRWYISKGKIKEARKSLQWLRGKTADISEELDSIQKMHIESERIATEGALIELFRKNHIKPVFISLGLMFFQQFSGINAVIFYTVQIFKVYIAFHNFYSHIYLQINEKLKFNFRIFFSIIFSLGLWKHCRRKSFHHHRRSRKFHFNVRCSNDYR